MKRSLPYRFWAETVMGSLTGLAFVATVFWRDWIEDTVGWIRISIAAPSSGCSWAYCSS